MFSIVFSCPWISSRVIVIIQARWWCCTEQCKWAACVSPCYSELGSGCGWLYSKPGVVSRQGAVFSAPASYYWLRAAGVKKAKVPGQFGPSLLTTPTWGRIRRFQEIPLHPPTHHLFLFVNIQHRHNVQKLNVLFTMDFHRHCTVASTIEITKESDHMLWSEFMLHCLCFGCVRYDEGFIPCCCSLSTWDPCAGYIIVMHQVMLFSTSGIRQVTL